MNNAVGGCGALRADLAQVVEARVASLQKEQLQTTTFPMLVSRKGLT
jgi:hypothetical protein